ncbi:MAG: hypothetical protein WA152_04440 [Microgenomates group bacterium]
MIEISTPNHFPQCANCDVINAIKKKVQESAQKVINKSKGTITGAKIDIQCLDYDTLNDRVLPVVSVTYKTNTYSNLYQPQDVSECPGLVARTK